jgi:hypothetical protein
MPFVQGKHYNVNKGLLMRSKSSLCLLAFRTVQVATFKVTLSPPEPENEFHLLVHKYKDVPSS